MAGPPIVIVSNRGPISLVADGDQLVPKRGAGGLSSGLAPLIVGSGATWIAAAMTDGDRVAAGRGAIETDGYRVRFLDIEADRYRMAYDVICNATLWFVHHGLFDAAYRPRFDTRWREAWEAYREANHSFADAVVDEAPNDAVVLVQDYHLTLLAPELRQRRPDLRLVHFSHTPFADPDAMRILPTGARDEMLRGMAAHDVCGFHTERWARAFERSCDELIATSPATFVAPLAPDPEDFRRVAESAGCAAALDDLERHIGDRQVIARVDRIELSKNILRGFHAFDDLLERYPDLRDRVVFVACCYPSREGLPEYLAYRQAVESLVERLNAKWGTDRWTPIIFDQGDDFPRSVAAMRRFDVLLVNPVRDGLNLVAKEGALVNERHGTVVLSIEAGAWAELHEVTIGVNPFDVSGTADALAQALTEEPGERRARAEQLRRVARSRANADWLEDQLRAAGDAPAR